MHIDARTLEDGSLIEGDICIVGAGAAGISMALECVGTPYNVILLEGGGFDYDTEMQDRYAGETTGRDYHLLQSTRMHMFGGTTGHWAGMCSPYDEVDFIKRDWVPHSGWPIQRKDLDVFYARAHKWLELGPYEYSTEYWEKKEPIRPQLPFDKAKVYTKMWQLSPPTRFGTRYREDIVSAKNIHLYTYAAVTNIAANESVSSVDELEIKCLNGKQHRVKARVYALATGTIQNARLLLASNRQARNGLGNDLDLVGRFFMDHPEVSSAFLAIPETRNLDLYMQNLGFASRNYRGELTLNRATQEELRILNITAGLYPATSTETADIRSNIQRQYPNAKVFKDQFDDNLERIKAGEKTPTISTESTIFRLFTRIEQAPNPASRITLGPERDELGVPRVQLNWQLTNLDKRTIRDFYHTLGEEVGRHGFGRIMIMDWVEEPDDVWPPFLGTGWHHMGTTRMHEDSKQGVVDVNCKVHGLSNLYVAGAAAFTTAGAANPTLTLVALSLRLSDHLKETMN
ncbi:MAG: FAD-dependent oxidoreductase [Rhodothermales bacterium]|nr:FAD-dependent oxidoreductase [Rhodothermales bacterium]